MRTLSDRLTSLRENSAEKIPADMREIMHRATDDLRTSGILDDLPKIGDPLPAFELPDTEGTTVRSKELLATGPLVVTFYRGVW